MFFLPCKICTHFFKIYLVHRKKAMKHETTVGRKMRSRKGTQGSSASLLASYLQANVYIPNRVLFSGNSLQMRKPTKNLQCCTEPVSLSHIINPPCLMTWDTVLHCLMWHIRGMLSLLTVITAVVKLKNISWRKHVCHAPDGMLQRCLEQNPIWKKDIKSAKLCAMELAIDQLLRLSDYLLENNILMS